MVGKAVAPRASKQGTCKNSIGYRSDARAKPACAHTLRRLFGSRQPWATGRTQLRALQAALGLLCVLMVAAGWLPVGGGLTTACAKAAKASQFYCTGADLVDVTKTGHCYHSIADCGNTKTSYRLTAREAVRLGYDACDNCDPFALSLGEGDFTLPQDETVVYLVVQDEHYHRDATCNAIQDQDGKYAPVAVTLAEAKHLDKKPCKTCKPPKK